MGRTQASAPAAAGADAGYKRLSELFAAVVMIDDPQGPAILKECQRLGL